MSTTTKTASAIGLAALLTLALFASPIGISRAQEGTETEATTPEASPESAPDRTPPTDEERAARQAEQDARKAATAQALADELGITVEELTAAFRTVATDQVEAALAAGEITDEQAAAMIERIEAEEGLPGLGRGSGGNSGGGRGHHGRPGGPADGDI